MNDLAKKYFPYADDETAAKQLASLERAKIWMDEQGVAAVGVGSKFEYKVATGAVLGAQK